MQTSSTRSRRKLTKWEWALLVVPIIVVIALLFGARILYALTGTLYTKQQEIGGINFSRDSKQLVAVTATDFPGDVPFRRDQDIMNWDVTTGKLLSKAEVRGKQVVWHPAVYENGTVIAAVIGSKSPYEVRRWHPQTGMTSISRQGSYSETLYKFKDDRSFIVIDSSTTIYDSQALTPIRTMPLGKVGSNVLISANEQVLFCERKTAKGVQGEVWSLRTGKRLRSFMLEESEMRAISPDGRQLATVSHRKESGLTKYNNVDVEIYDLTTGKKLKRAFHNIKSVFLRSFRFSSNGEKLLCAGPIFAPRSPQSRETKEVQQSVAQIINIKSNKISTLNIAGHLRSCMFSPDGRLVAFSTMRTSTTSASFQIRNAENDRVLLSRDSGAQEISFRFSPDNRLVAYSSGNSIKVVDISNLS